MPFFCRAPFQSTVASRIKTITVHRDACGLAIHAFEVLFRKRKQKAFAAQPNCTGAGTIPGLRLLDN